MALHKLVFPQEVEVHYIIPGMRREFAIAMKGMNIEQKKIAKYLVVSEAAVSQYLSDKRATEVQFSDAVKALIASAAERLIKTNNFMEEGSKILNYIKQEKTTCKICVNFTHEKDKSCKMCFNLPELIGNKINLIQLK
ncbi:hypothetical protein J4457_00870 [Candidatus Woesearchaeota archaeon]|nr:hypothetical protein [Candidatus Woesearchaeota archaeon]